MMLVTIIDLIKHNKLKKFKSFTKKKISSLKILLRKKKENNSLKNVASVNFKMAQPKINDCNLYGCVCATHTHTHIYIHTHTHVNPHKQQY